MKRATKLRLAIIVPALLVVSIGSWIGVNKLVARQLPLNEFIHIGETEAAAYVLKWQPSRKDEKEEVIRIAMEFRLHYGDAKGFYVLEPWHVAPLMVASSCGHADIVRLLIEEKADVNTRDSIYNHSPLHYAANGGVAALLLQAGADIEARGNAGDRPLHRATAGGHIGTVRVLVTAGADVDAKGALGRTSLHHAASHAHVEAVEILIEVSADINAADKDGETPLDRTAPDLTSDQDPARLNTCVALLRKHGAKTAAELKVEKK